MYFKRMILFLSFVFLFISSPVLLSGTRLIQRSTDTVNWTSIGEKPAFGESSIKRDYSFIDNSIFKNNVSNFYYRLVIVEKNGHSTPYDVIVSITGGSGIKHTWGSIKALFR